MNQTTDGHTFDPKRTYPDQHPLARSSSVTFRAAREGIEASFSYLESTNWDDPRRLRVALGGISAACDALKAAANAYSTMLGHVQRGGA